MCVVVNENISNSFYLTKQTRKCDHGQTDGHTDRDYPNGYPIREGQALNLPTETFAGVKLTISHSFRKFDWKCE